MTREWQVKIGDDAIAYAGDLGIEEIGISYASLAADMATLRCSPDLSLAYGTMVGIYYAGTRRFLGRARRGSPRGVWLNRFQPPGRSISSSMAKEFWMMPLEPGAKFHAPPGPRCKVFV